MTTATIDPGKKYRVFLARSVQIAPGTWARPSDKIVMLGSELVAVLEFVASYEEI